MTRKEALTEVLEKVEAGTLEHTDSAIIVTAFPDIWNGDTLTISTVVEPHLNGMEALHEAVLPGWRWEGYEGECWRVWERRKPEEYFESWGKDPARSWLIAIIKALIAQEE